MLPHFHREKAIDFGRILVPVTGIGVDDEVLKLACQLARKSKNPVYAAYVITVKRALPLEAELESETHRAEEVLDHMEKVAEEQACDIQTTLLQAREAGPAVIKEALERKIDLILMGLKYSRRFGQFALGATALYILKNAPCRVMLYQEYNSD